MCRGISTKNTKRQTIGRFWIGSTIGEGAFSKVKYGEDKVTGEPVAVKFMTKNRLSKAGMLKQTDQEVKISSGMKHPHIVDVKEVIVHHEKICIVMEYVGGGTLFEKIAYEGPLPEQKALPIFMELLDALEYCHDKGICHRDLKPENILLSVDNGVKLIDFGLSGLFSEDDKDNGFFKTTCGTPNYTAPEILKQAGYYGAPADVWSLGVVLYVMITGKLPFADRSLQRLFRRIMTGTYEAPKLASPAVQDLLKRMLTPNPAERISINDIRTHSWITKGFLIDSAAEMSTLKADSNAIERSSSVSETKYADSASESLMMRVKLSSDASERKSQTASEKSWNPITNDDELLGLAIMDQLDSAEEFVVWT